VLAPATTMGKQRFVDDPGGVPAGVQATLGEATRPLVRVAVVGANVSY
jgi:hypothetical protein